MAETKKDRYTWKAGDIVWLKKPQAVKNTAKKAPKKTTKKGK